MSECSASISRIALNLTDEQFKGYCKGMALHWMFKGLDKSDLITGKRVKFWDRAYDKHKHNCKGDL